MRLTPFMDSLSIFVANRRKLNSPRNRREISSGKFPITHSMARINYESPRRTASPRASIAGVHLPLTSENSPKRAREKFGRAATKESLTGLRPRAGAGSASPCSLACPPQPYATDHSRVLRPSSSITSVACNPRSRVRSILADFRQQ